MAQVLPWFSITRSIGMVAYACSILACLLAFRLQRRGLRGRAAPDGFFLLLGCFQFALAVDMALDLRWKLHDYLMHRAMARGVYAERHSPQLLALILLAIALVVCVLFLAAKLRRKPGRFLALASSVCSVLLSCVETLSYHPVDQILYHKIGSAMLVAFLWLTLSAILLLGVWLDLRGSPKSLGKNHGPRNGARTSRLRG